MSNYESTYRTNELLTELLATVKKDIEKKYNLIGS